MIDVNISSQSYTFLCSLLNGLILAFIYTVFKCIRVVFKNRKILTVFCDILYMLVFALFTCIFSIGFTNGFVRYYVVAGELMVLIIYKFTLGILVDKAFFRIFKLLHRFFVFLRKNIAIFVKKLLKANHNMLYNKIN